MWSIYRYIFIHNRKLLSGLRAPLPQQSTNQPLRSISHCAGPLLTFFAIFFVFEHLKRTSEPFSLLSFQFSPERTLNFYPFQLKIQWPHYRRREKPTNPSRKQALPPGIITKAETFSTPLAHRLYVEQCALHQVIKGRSVENSAFVCQIFHFFSCI